DQAADGREPYGGRRRRFPGLLPRIEVFRRGNLDAGAPDGTAADEILRVIGARTGRPAGPRSSDRPGEGRGLEGLEGQAAARDEEHLDRSEIRRRGLRLGRSERRARAARDRSGREDLAGEGPDTPPGVRLLSPGGGRRVYTSPAKNGRSAHSREVFVRGLRSLFALGLVSMLAAPGTVPGAPAKGKKAPEGSMDETKPRTLSNLFEGMEFRCIGPYRGGRSTAVSGVRHDPLTFYFGGTGGGVWKTTDGGSNWENVSDKDFKTGSVGAMAVSESDPN